MSFCSEVKSELSALKLQNCCSVAQCYGLLLFSKSFSYKEISHRTQQHFIAKLYSSTLKNNFAVLTSIRIGGEKVKNYSVGVNTPAECTRIMEAFGYNSHDPLFINRDVFKKECCFGAFIRGAFLACGQMSDPFKNYHAEFVIRDLSLALSFYELLEERGLSPLRSMRRNSMVIYFNKSETIEELLTVMGATSKVFELIDVQITKNIRNKENRKNNLELGNIDKHVEAFIVQSNAIEKLKQSGRFNLLDKSLIKVAELRINNPEASLSELCKLSDEPITRSGMNHRIKKLIELAENEK